MDLTNDDKMKEILTSCHPKLYELFTAVKDNDLNPDTIIRACYELGKAKKSKRCGSVTITCAKDIEEVLPGQQGETSGQLQEAIHAAGVDEIDIMRGLFLMANIKRFTGWGSVVYLWQDRRLVQVVQEQRYKVD